MVMGESEAASFSNCSNSKRNIESADCIKCPHCAGPLSKSMETSHWTVPPLIRDSFSMIGSAVGGTTSAFYGFNHVMPVVQRRIKGPMWLHFLIGELDSERRIGSAKQTNGLYLLDVPNSKVGAVQGSTNYCILVSMCWFSRWCCASTCSACILFLSCHDVFIIFASIVTAG